MEGEFQSRTLWVRIFTYMFKIRCLAEGLHERVGSRQYRGDHKINLSSISEHIVTVVDVINLMDLYSGVLVSTEDTR